MFGDFDVMGTVLLPRKAHPVLIVDSDTPLSLPVSGESFQPVARWDSQIVKDDCIVQHDWGGEGLLARCFHIL
jgi:hypothetical protein